MKCRNAALVVVAALLACGGQRLRPKSLEDARADMQRAKDGIAQQLDPTDVHEAEVAMQRAELAFQDAPDDPSSSDLATIADRKALMAISTAEGMQAQRETEQTKRQVQALMATRLRTTQGALSQTEQALTRQQQDAARQAAQFASQSSQLAEAQNKLREARDTIAKIATVKDDERGTVITLQGEVLFKTGKSDLKPAALAKLEPIASFLKDKEQPISVTGHTDSVGSHDMNMDLSRRRADAVADYLVHEGVPKDLVTAQGMGPDRPVSDNGSVDGRAANRRVEIVVQPRK